MRSATFSIALTALVAGANALTYEYFIGNTQFHTPHPDRPVTINHQPIGTAELETAATVGTRHDIADGHHFGHAGWLLTENKTTAGDIFWEYRGPRKSQQAKKDLDHPKRQSDQPGFSFLDLVESDEDDSPDDVLDDFDWDFGTPLTFADEFPIGTAEQVDWVEYFDFEIEFLTTSGSVDTSILSGALDNLFAIGWELFDLVT